MRDRRKRDYGYEAITNDVLVEILQESIRVIWQFIRADKDHNTTGGTGLKRPKKFQVELQDPADYQLLTEIQTELQKVSFSFISIHFLSFDTQRAKILIFLHSCFMFPKLNMIN